MKLAKIIFIIFGLFFMGLILLLLAYLSYNSESELRYWDKVSATVISVETSKNRKGGLCPHIFVQYEYREMVYESELKTKEFPCGPNFKKSDILEYRLNENVDIFINPENPKLSKSINYRKGSFFMYVFFIIGVIFVLTPVGAYIEMRLRKRYSEREN
jgi:hypothetical protein